MDVGARAVERTPPVLPLGLAMCAASAVLTRALLRRVVKRSGDGDRNVGRVFIVS